MPGPPQFEVRIDGTALAGAAAADVVSVSVLDDVEGPSMFAIEMMNWNAPKLQMKYSDQDLFKPGKSTEIDMGYGDQRETLLSGETTGLELSIRGDDFPRLTVRGYDKAHRLLRGRKSTTYTNMKDSDIANQIAANAGLSADVEDTGTTLQHIWQHNQSDLEFLQERAARIGYEVRVQARKLLFQSRKTQKQEALTLNREVDLLEFYPRLSVVNQVGTVSVRGWDPAQKKPIVGQADSSSISNKMGGADAGPSIGDSAFGDSTSAAGNRPVSDQGEADKMAKAFLGSVALEHITGDGVCIGRNDLRAGMVIKVEGLGTRFSGLYYVTTATHRYTPQKGYRTEFSVERNASG